MRVLAITPTYFPIVGGAELLLSDVLGELTKDNDIELLVPHLPEYSADFWVGEAPADETSPFPVRRFSDSVSLLKMRGHRFTKGAIPPMSLSAIGVLQREIRRFRPDVLLTFFGVPFGLPSVLLRYLNGIQLVVVFCGTDIPSPRTRGVPGWSRYLRFVSRHANRAVYVSRFCFDVLDERDFDRRRDFVIHGGVREELLASARKPERVRADLGLGPDDILLFSLQRLGPEKRTDVLIRALALLPQSERTIRLVIGGQGTETDSLRSLATALGVSDKVVFTGHLGDGRADYYAACDIFVFHSLFETFGQVLAEAMSFGKPVVTAAAGATTEVVSSGECGLLVPPKDPAALASALAELMADPAKRDELGKRALARARTEYDWATQAKMWRTAVLGTSPPAADTAAPVSGERLGLGN